MHALLSLCLAHLSASSVIIASQSSSSMCTKKEHLFGFIPLRVAERLLSLALLILDALHFALVPLLCLASIPNLSQSPLFRERLPNPSAACYPHLSCWAVRNGLSSACTFDTASTTPPVRLSHLRIFLELGRFDLIKNGGVFERLPLCSHRIDFPVFLVHEHLNLYVGVCILRRALHINKASESKCSAGRRLFLTRTAEFHSNSLWYPQPL